eukprot:4120749-Pyramimonas_sp.AAC.1
MGRRRSEGWEPAEGRSRSLHRERRLRRQRRALHRETSQSARQNRLRRRQEHGVSGSWQREAVQGAR